MTHVPVLLREAVDGMNVKPFGTYLDATFGGGGHTKAICDASAGTANIVAIDADPDAIERSKTPEYRERVKCSLYVAHGNYADAEAILKDRGITTIDGALFDLGLSSFQLDESGRGFSFMRDEPLVMRMGKGASTDGPRGELTAGDVVNGFSEKGLADVIFAYGEERFARRIAAEIVRRREHKPIETTFQLVEAIAAAVPGWYRYGKSHYATRTFQGIRIAVNNELENVERGLASAFEVLAPGARLAIISFHSLEDRISKRFCEAMSEAGCATKITKKPIAPSSLEITKNPRSRSAKLRIIERI
jgi:16S rRNA (cytosine1402-N4)-methyltransferase